MPFSVAPALTKLANGENLYVPIEGDTAIMPPKVGTRSPPINFVAPIDVTYAPQTPADIGYSINANGPVKIDFPPDPAGSGQLNALEVVGNAVFSNPSQLNVVDVLGKLTASSTLIGDEKITGTFELPDTNPLKIVTLPRGATDSTTRDIYQISSIRIGNMRVAWGTTYANSLFYAIYYYYLNFSQLPANTFANQPNKGLFKEGEVVCCMASINNVSNVLSGAITQLVYNPPSSPSDAIIGINKIVYQSQDEQPVPPLGLTCSFIAIGQSS